MANPTEICGIVCEFNPLHKGHQLILKEAQKHGAAVCVMSGNFVQRGEPAIIDKWARTELALRSGASLVIELPLPYAMSGAERFAGAAVFLLHSLGLGGSVIFGSECGDIRLLTDTARLLLSEDFEQKLAQNLQNSTQSYAAVREEALRQTAGDVFGDVLRQPNNILGVEYIKALLRLNSELTPRTIRRLGSGHDQTALSGELHAAGELRQMLYVGKSIRGFVPDAVYASIETLKKDGKLPSSPKKLEIAILCKLRTLNADDFARLPDISEGLEFRLQEAVKTAGTLQELFGSVKSKRYSHARIRRLIMSAFLSIDNSPPVLPPYVRVLGMDSIGEQILRQKSGGLPLCIRPRDFEAAGGEALRLFRLEARADDVYALSFPVPRPCALDYTMRFIKI